MNLKKTIMKTFKKIIYSVLCLALVYSCEYDDSPLNEDVVAQNTGAILTTISTVGSTINKNFPSESSIESTVLFNDFLNNETMEAVDVYILFTDTSPVDGEVLTIPEALVETIPASDFVIGESGYPENTYTITGATMLNALNLDVALIDGGDRFTLRYDLKLTDGRSFSAADTGINVQGTSFQSPFRYGATVVCIAPPPAGTWTIDMFDSYGDGWQPTSGSGGGAGITITLDSGAIIELGLCTPYETPGYDCVDESSEGTDTFEIPEGTESAEFFYNGDNWGEMSFDLYAPSGNLVASAGANTPAGPIALNLCRE
jgi:hypothetical protein